MKRPRILIAIVLLGIGFFVADFHFGLDRLWNEPIPGTGGYSGQHAAIPCRSPLPWRVGEIDPRFQVDRSEVTAAARRAAELWEEAVGRPLFPRDPDEGLPVRLEFDERQAELRRTIRRRRTLEDDRRALDAERLELRIRESSLRTEWEEYERRRRALEERMARHDDRVRRLDQREEPSREALGEAHRERSKLEEELRVLEERRRELELRTERLRRDGERLQRRSGTHNERRGERPVGTVSDGPVTAAGYSETVETRDGRVVSVEDRAIRIYQFADREALVRLIAHELGHALGLRHVADPEGLMSATAAEVLGRRESVEVRPADLREFRAQCPELVPRPRRGQ